jgi:hypothetical protein
MNLRSTAVLFRNFGRNEGELASLKCRVEYLKLDRWQKALRLGRSADQGERWKAYLKKRAQALLFRLVNAFACGFPACLIFGSDV